MLCKRTKKGYLRTASPVSWLLKNLRFQFLNTCHKAGVYRKSHVQFTGTTAPPENTVGDMSFNESNLPQHVSSSVNIISCSQRSWKVLVSISNPSHDYLITVVTISQCSCSLCLLQKNIFWCWPGSDCLVSGRVVEAFHSGERKLLGFVSCPL